MRNSREHWLSILCAGVLGALLVNASSLIAQISGGGIAGSESGGGTPGGVNTSVQYNDNGALGGEASFTYNSSTDTFTAANIVASTSCTGCGSITQTTGTFEVTFPNSCSTSPSQTWNYTSTGDAVTVWVTEQISCTSDAITFNTGATNPVPMAIRPTVGTTFWTNAVDNGVGTEACVQFTTGGGIFINPDQICAGNWNSSGTKSFPAQGTNFPAFTWSIGAP